jgi:hypothetical protein
LAESSSVTGSQQEASVRVANPTFPGLLGSGEAFTIKKERYSLKMFARLDASKITPN